MKKSNSSKMEPTLDIYLKGEKVQVKINSISIKNLYFDEFNPRISLYRDSQIGSLKIDSLNQDQIMFSLITSPSYHDLKNSIIDNNGIMNPLWIHSIGNGKYCVIEGNTRLAIYKELNEEYPTNIDYMTVNCYVLDKKIDDDVKDFIRLTAHLNGQTPWDKYEQAKYLYILWNDKRYPISELVKRTKLSRKEIQEDIEAYQIMEQEFSKVFPQNDRSYVHKYSYFKEFVKNSKLKSIMDENNLDKKDFSIWVAENKVYHAQDVRKLPDIIRNKESRELFIKKDFDRAHEKLKQIIPERSDKIYQTMDELTNKLGKMTVSQLSNIDIHKEEIIRSLRDKLNEILKRGG